MRLVVRLNERRYDPAHFERAGIAVLPLPFADCAIPPSGVVFRFLRAADAAASAGSAVAVHCKAGLGRTGTLIALWLMRSRQFSAREAIAWLRIVRPGSVIGPQQHFLVALEGKMWRWGALPPAQRDRLLRRGCELTAPPAREDHGGGDDSDGDRRVGTSGQEGCGGVIGGRNSAAAAAMAQAVSTAVTRREAGRRANVVAATASSSFGVAGPTAAAVDCDCDS